jgi:hypothetical protein
MRAMAGATEVGSAWEVNGLDCQTTITALIERKGLFGGMPNRSNEIARDGLVDAGRRGGRSEGIQAGAVAPWRHRNAR